MLEEKFPIRLAQLRSRKGISAREMSIELGQNVSYINNIENGKALPSMSSFFSICEYLGITAQEFFDTEVQNPERLNEVIDDLKKLNDSQLDALSVIVKDLAKS